MEHDPVEILNKIAEFKYVSEPDVLVREVRMILDLGEMNPELRIKVWRSEYPPSEPYSYELSHYAWTPEQAGPYRPGSRSNATEEGAIKSAVLAVATCLQAAIDQGHEPNEPKDWLVPNENY